MASGLLVSFEGLDGAGKTTQMDLLEKWLIDRHVPYLRTREPGGTPLGVEIRRLLFHHPELTITPLAEAFLFQSDRAQHFTTKIVPALQAGKLVVTDRCFDSSIAYQGAARGIGTDLVEQLSLLATGGLVPDLTFFLDLAPALVRERTDVARDQREELSRFDSEAEQFHQRLRGAFLAQAQAHPERIKVIDASLSPEQVHQQIISHIQPLLSTLST